MEIMFIVEANGTRLAAFNSSSEADEYARDLVAKDWDLVMSYPVEADEDLFHTINR